MKTNRFEKVVLENYSLTIAGRLWSFAKVEYTKMPNGALTMSMNDLARYQEAVVLRICEENRRISLAEFDLLCLVAKLQPSKLLEMMQVERTTYYKWKNSEKDETEKLLNFPYSFLACSLVWSILVADLDQRKSLKKDSAWVVKKKELPSLAA